MHSIWNERQNFPVTAQRLCDQARLMRKNGWLTELQHADIKKRQVNVSVEEIGDNEMYVGAESMEENDKEDLIHHGPLTYATILELSHQER